MPTPAASSSVFARLRRRDDLKGLEQEDQSQALDEDADHPHSLSSHRSYRHRRESSLLSISSSVTDFRRSVSQRSHRSQPSAASVATLSSIQNPSNHSAANLLRSSPEPDNAEPDLPSPPRHRSKLSFSTRSFSKSHRTNTLPGSVSDKQQRVPNVPPLTAIEQAFSMLTVAPIKRQIAEKQAFSNNTSRDGPASHHGGDAASPPPPSSGGQNPYSIFQQIHETAAKRTATIQYLRRVHEGDVHFFNTLHYTPAALASLPSLNPQKLGRRATSYFLLGYSLPVLLDMNPGSPLEYLKPLTSLLQEFETYQNMVGVENSGSLSRGRVGQMLKSGMGLGKGAGKTRRASTTADAFYDPILLGLPTPVSSMPLPQDVPSSVNPTGYEFAHLLTPHMPFDPDFGVAFSALCDALVDMYTNIVHMVSGSEACTPSVAEAFSKADKSIRKILVSNVMKELEDNARSGARMEIGGLSKLVLGGLM